MSSHSPHLRHRCHGEGRQPVRLAGLLIPFVNIVCLAIVFYDLARSFGKGGELAVGLFFLAPIFMPILGYRALLHLPRPGGQHALTPRTR